ncbi:kinase-like domain-containing protein [Lactarius vividus]|nr:kinase-like domain-containing protein [Lactarius vividus]
MDSRGVRSRDQLSLGVIKGLAHLHEYRIAHRDVKPGDLVCDDVFRLEIIDFDVAIEVQDEHEYRGTRNWTAPEMGEEDGPTPMYNTIKADRWSCGRVLLRHIMQRPSLLTWDRWSAVSLSDMANVLGMSRDPGKTW